MSSKAEQVRQAAKVAKSTKKRAIRRKYQVRDKLRFFKPRTLQVASKPKYLRSTTALKAPAKFDKYSVLINPINT
jgi:large subunit ribosomal protein L23Ae